LFSIAEQPKGDVLIIHKAIGAFSPMASHAGSAIAKQHNTRFIEDRISIHESKYSDDAVNVVKYTLTFEKNAIYSSVNYTHAIKSGSCASFLFTRRYPNLRNHFYNSSGDATSNIELGSYNPTDFTIVASVFVCAPNYHLMEGDGRDFTVKQIPFGKCKLVILWSYLSHGSSPGFYTLYASTKPPEESEKFYNPGSNPWEAMVLFETQRELIRREFISRTVNLSPEIQEAIFYARTPDIDSPEVLQAILAKRVAKDIRDGKVGGPAGTPLAAELGFILESLWKKKGEKDD
jgi:hypothetical protein